VANLDCEHDAAALKRGLADRPGIAEIDVYPKAAKVRVRFDPAATSAAEVRRQLGEAGFATPATLGTRRISPGLI